MKTYKSRKEVEDKYKWDLSDFFNDDKEYKKLFDEAKKKAKDLNKYVGCTKNAKKLYEFLELDMHTLALIERLYVYSVLVNDIELGKSKNLNRKNKATDLFSLYSVNTNFFEPELLKLTKEEYNKLFEEYDLLKEYKIVLDDIYRNKDHILCEKEENIITELVNSMDHFSEMSSTMLNSEHDYGKVIIDGEENQISNNNLGRLMKCEKRDIRKEIRTKFYSVIDKYSVSSAQFLNGYVKGNITVSKLHNFKDAWEAKLFGLKLSDKVFKTLVNVAEKHVDSLQRYYKIFKRHFGFDELYQYDTGLELTEIKKEYSIEDAQKICLEAVKPLGQDYVKHFKRIFDNKYIDYAQYPSKRSGAYSFAPLDRHSKILMSYNYDFDSISTIIHEGGHNVHDQYVFENNPLQYRAISTFISEVPSLTNECLLSSYMAKKGTTKDEKIAGIANIVDVFNANFFAAVREGKMEEDFYQYVCDGNSITHDYMNSLTEEYLKKYYGDSVTLDEFSKLFWTRRNHYYKNYYLYSYAVCVSIASNIAKEILDGNKEMLSKYQEFLKAGSDKEPMEAFAILGIDLEDESVYEKGIEYFDSMLDELEKLV